MDWEQKYKDLKALYDKSIPQIVHTSEPAHIKELRSTKDFAIVINSMLTDEFLFSKNSFCDYFIIDIPKNDKIGGDFCFYEQIGNKFYFGVFDCTGHSLNGLISSLFARYIFQKAIHFSVPDCSLVELLENIDNQIYNLQKNSPYNISIECIMCCYEIGDNFIEFIGTNLSIYHANNNFVTAYKSSNKFVGDIKNRSEFKSTKIFFQKGDLFYLPTDGFENQSGGIKGRKYKYKLKDETANDETIDKSNSFKKLIEKIYKLDLQLQKDTINQELVDWKATNFEQNDDILILGIKMK